MKVDLTALEHARVLVVGDVMLDRYWHGGTSRISPEAPVPVVRVEDADDRPGGAANVALNIASLGAHAALAGLVGDDDNADRLTARLEEVRTRIRHHFDNVIAAPEDDEAEQGEGQQALDEWRALWRGELTAEEGEALLAESGFESAAESFRRLDSLRRSRAVQGMQRIGFDRLDALMPPLLQALGSAAGRTAARCSWRPGPRR